MLLRLNYHVANLSASLEISLPYQAVYYYLLDNPVSGPSFVPTVIAALHPSNIEDVPAYSFDSLSQHKIEWENHPEEKDQTWEEFAVVG